VYLGSVFLVAWVASYKAKMSFLCKNVGSFGSDPCEPPLEEEEEKYLVTGTLVEVLYIFSWKSGIVLAKASSDTDEEYFLVRLLEVENYLGLNYRDVEVHRSLIRRQSLQQHVQEKGDCDEYCCPPLKHYDEDQEENVGEKRCGSYGLKLPCEDRDRCSPVKKPSANRTMPWDHDEEEEEEPLEAHDVDGDDIESIASSVGSCGSNGFAFHGSSDKDHGKGGIDLESEFSDADSVCRPNQCLSTHNKANSY